MDPPAHGAEGHGILHDRRSPEHNGRHVEEGDGELVDQRGIVTDERPVAAPHTDVRDAREDQRGDEVTVEREVRDRAEEPDEEIRPRIEVHVSEGVSDRIVELRQVLPVVGSCHHVQVGHDVRGGHLAQGHR